MSATYKCDVCGVKLSKTEHHNPYEDYVFVKQKKKQHPDIRPDIRVVFSVDFNQYREYGICRDCGISSIIKAIKSLRERER